MTSIAFRNVEVFDGLGGEPFITDVGVKAGRIDCIGQVSTAQVEIEGEGYVLSPGFIDTHAHDDGAFIRHPGMEFKLQQGVTSVVSGNCGFSAIPSSPDVDQSAASGGILAGLKGDFVDLEGYFATVLSKEPSINNMMLVGHNTVRSMVLGDAKRAPTTAELAIMRDHIRLALEQGCCGFSSGLIYRPGRYSDTEEVVELAKVAGEFDALYTTHMRNEGDKLLDAVDEALLIGKESGSHLHISHHKAAGKANWGKVSQSLMKVEEALVKGQAVTLDIYPYTAGSGRMIEYFNLDNPNEELARTIRIASCPANRLYEGRMLVDIAKEEGKTMPEMVRSVLLAPEGDKTLCIQFVISEEDVETNIKQRDMMIGSDGIPDLKGRPHPRLFGTFPRVLGHYVRERKLIGLAEAIRRMTSLPARIFGMKERGRVAEGYHADLVLFDSGLIADQATYDQPMLPPVGIKTVVVNGEIALSDGEATGAGSGRMLRYRNDYFSPR